MPLYQFQAGNYQGDIVKDTLDAPDEASVVAHIQAQGLIPVKIRKTSKWSLSVGGGNKVKATTLSVFTMELATLLEAGLPLDRSLNILISMEDTPAWRLVLEDLLAKVKSGSSLSAAMREQQNIFSDFYIGLVQAGELSGALNTVLERLADYLEKRLETRSAIRSALFYPTLLIVVGMAIVVYLLVGVIPKFAEIIARNKTEVPFFSDIVFALSGAMVNYWYLLLTAMVLLVIVVKAQLHPSNRDKLDVRLLKLPMFGQLIRKSELAKLARTLGTMLTHGVPLATALNSVHAAVGNRVLGQTISDAMQSLKGGRGMARVLIDSKAFPTLGVQMIKVGEETGQLEKMLMKVADIYDKEVKNSTKAIVATIGPIAILTIAAFVFLIMVGVIMALFAIG